MIYVIQYVITYKYAITYNYGIKYVSLSHVIFNRPNIILTQVKYTQSR